MQVHVHRFPPTLARRLATCAAALAAMALSTILDAQAARAQPYVSAWASGQKSSVRLIAAPSGQGPFPWRAGVEIRLAPGALTYWRTPGGAGVAPIFSFARSRNLARVEVDYPAPTRIEEEGTDVYGYKGEVTFPLRISPSEPGTPMELSLTLVYAICDRICLPAKAELALDLPAAAVPSPADAPQLAVIARAEALVPQRLEPPRSDAALSVSAVKGSAPPAWKIVSREPASDLFVEAADGWYFDTRKGEEPGAFLVVEADAPKGAPDPAVPVTLTVTGPDRSYELSAVLDRSAAAR